MTYDYQTWMVVFGEGILMTVMKFGGSGLFEVLNAFEYVILIWSPQSYFSFVSRTITLSSNISICLG